MSQGEYEYKWRDPEPLTLSTSKPEESNTTIGVNRHGMRTVINLGDIVCLRASTSISGETQSLRKRARARARGRESNHRARSPHVTKAASHFAGRNSRAYIYTAWQGWRYNVITIA
jgi:hypothetical protein